MAENSQEQPRRRGQGRPFQPGQSGNPGGRPKELAEVKELARRHAPEAIRTLVALMKEADKDAVRVAAAQALLDRGYGKPTQPVAGDGDGAPLQIIVQKEPEP